MYRDTSVRCDLPPDNTHTSELQSEGIPVMRKPHTILMISSQMKACFSGRRRELRAGVTVYPWERDHLAYQLHLSRAERENIAHSVCF